MGLDSVELLIVTEETFGITITDADAEQLVTPGMLIDHVQRAVGSQQGSRPCLTQRAFHRVRTSLVTATGLRRRDISPKSKVRDVFPKPLRAENWQKFRMISGLTDLPDLRFGRGVIFDPTTVSSLVSQEVTRMAGDLTCASDWSDEEVRSAVRMIISEQLGIEKFSDDDEFVRDLGVD